MNDAKQPVFIRQLRGAEPVPYDLLLLADPSREQVDRYLPGSELYVMVLEELVIGALVLYPLDEQALEIKNIAIDPQYQGKGYGNALIHKATGIAKTNGYSRIVISTANSSPGPLHLYQKSGFEITGLQKDFFTIHYPEAIYENGIRAKDLIVLSKTL